MCSSSGCVASTLEYPPIAFGQRRSVVELQRNVYSGGFYRRFRRLRWLLRYDCRYRLLLMEELFLRHDIPFERQRVFELGFGTGDLLLRFDTSCAVHGCEISADAIRMVEVEAAGLGFDDVELALAGAGGEPVFPRDDYDIVLASHVLEHVPDDGEALRLLAAHTRPGGWGLFFVPLERPRGRHLHHARTYSPPGFCKLCGACGWQVVEAESSMRFDSFSENLVAVLEQRLNPVAGVVEGARNIVFSLFPPELLRVSDACLAKVHKPPRQLAVLARRGCTRTSREG